MSFASSTAARKAPPCPRWSVERLKRAVKRFVTKGLADAALLRPATRKSGSKRLLTLVAGVKRANPDLSLAQIGAQQEAMFERTPRGGTRWAPTFRQKSYRPRRKTPPDRRQGGLSASP